MSRIRFPILALLCSCAAPTLATADGSKCVTPCGAWTRAGNCEGLQRFEGRVVSGLAGVSSMSEKQLCTMLNGWEIRIHTHDPKADVLCVDTAWAYIPGFCVWGFTHEAEKVIEVSTSQWERSSLAHEIAHVIGPEDRGHCRWGNLAFRAVIESLEGRQDLNRPNPARCSP